jgi:hypothetical protein
MTNQLRWAIAILQTRPDQAPGQIPSGADPGRSSVRRGFALGRGLDESPADGFGLEACTDRPRRGRIAATNEHPRRITMDKKAKNPKKPKQTKTKDGAGKGK